MREGLLWFDNDPKRSLEEKVSRAAERYFQKFGRRPDTCYVNPSMVPEQGGARPTAVRVIAAKNILPHHLWVGVAPPESQDLQKRAS